MGVHTLPRTLPHSQHAPNRKISLHLLPRAHACQLHTSLISQNYTGRPGRQQQQQQHGVHAAAQHKLGPWLCAV